MAPLNGRPMDTMTPNPRFEGSAEQRRRCSVPVALRAPAPPQPQR